MYPNKTAFQVISGMFGNIFESFMECSNVTHWNMCTRTTLQAPRKFGALESIYACYFEVGRHFIMFNVSDICAAIE